jgi:hypothetical protein
MFAGEILITMQQQFNEEIPVYANEMAKQGCS